MPADSQETCRAADFVDLTAKRFAAGGIRLLETGKIENRKRCSHFSLPSNFIDGSITFARTASMRKHCSSLGLKRQSARMKVTFMLTR